MRSPQNIEDGLSTSNSDNWDISLYPVIESLVSVSTKYFGDNFFKLSNAIGTMVDGQIISVIKSEERDIFEFLISFRIPALIILFAVLIIPITFALIDKSFSGFITNIWDLLSVLVSEAIVRIPQSGRKRLLLMLWLLTCTILLSSYSGNLRDNFMKSTSEKAIDSWEDLMERQDLKILTHEYSFIYKFGHSYDNEMARNFRQRFFNISYIDINYTDIMDKLLSGRYVISAPTYWKDVCNLYATKPTFCERVHVSKFGGVTSSYFIAFNYLIDKDLEKQVNQM